MSWVAIAKKDFRDARRAKILWGATAIFVFFYAVFLLTAGQGNQPAEEAATDALGALIFAGAFLLPLVLISMAYLAIAGERESGSIKYLLGLPNSRRDVLVGKFLGRSAVALTAVGIAVIAGAAMLLFNFGTIPAEYVVYAGLTGLFSLAFVAIAVGVSAFAASRGKAMAGSIGGYFVFGVLWIVPGVTPQDSVAFVVEDLLGMDATPELYHFVEQLSPVMAYAAAVQGFVYGTPDDPGSVEFHPAASDTPFYLTDDFMVVVLLAWIVVPLAIGYWRFNRAELG
jgi:ABC-2 type transport system permease protein